MVNVGFVEWFGISNSGGFCNYCKSDKPEDADHGMWAHHLTTDNYQNLIDRGWRRSGKYCYKPTMNRTCCPTYTIRCDATNLRLSKSQKKVAKRVNEFLKTGNKPKLRVPDPVKEHVSLNETSSKDIGSKAASSIQPKNLDQLPSKTKKLKSEDDPKKAKQIRIERRVKKIVEKNNCSTDEALERMKSKHEIKKSKRQPKTLEEWLFPKMPPNQAHKLEIRFVSTLTDQYKDTLETSHSIYKKYQTTIHNDDIGDCTPKQFKRFLIDSPLILEKFNDLDSDLPNQLGSYHIQYWLDGTRMIAVGVVDILPSCVSSVYLYYDPEFSFLTLGTYSALRELALVRQYEKIRPELKYYYLGFYIHGVPKMRYKGQYHPPELLCPETFTWHPMRTCVPKLDISKYSRLDEDLNAVDDSASNIQDEDIQIYYNDRWIDYKMYKKYADEEEDAQIKEFAKLVGNRVIDTMLLFRKVKSQV